MPGIAQHTHDLFGLVYAQYTRQIKTQEYAWATNPVIKPQPSPPDSWEGIGTALFEVKKDSVQ